MNISGIPIYRGIDERRESLIAEQLASGLLKKHPDSAVDGRCKPRGVSDEFKLSLVLELADYVGSARSLAKIKGICHTSLHKYKLEYLTGGLGEVDSEVVRKLKK